MINKREFIFRNILCKIYQNKYKNSKLPSQRKLAKTYEVSRYTIQKVVDKLNTIGIISTIQGNGMYIREDATSNPLIFNTLTETPYNEIESKIISFGLERASEQEQKIFQLNKDETVWKFTRLRLVNFQLQQIEYSIIPFYLIPNLCRKDIGGSIHEKIIENNLEISHFITEYSPVNLTNKEAKLLRCKKTLPALKIENECFLTTGNICEYSIMTALDYKCSYIYPFDKYNFSKRKA